MRKNLHKENKINKPNFKVAHPYAYLLRSITIGLLFMLMSVSSFIVFPHIKFEASESEAASWAESVVTLPSFSGYSATGGFVGSFFAGGDGSSSNPYIVKTTTQLLFVNQFSDYFNGAYGYYFALGADIDLSGKTWDSIAGTFSPTSTKSTTGSLNTSKGFGGSFNGNGYKITGLNGTGGLFASILQPSTLSTAYGVYNLSILNARISTSNFSIGILCNSIGKSNIRNVLISGSISTSNKRAGGFAGYCSDGVTMTNCINYATVQADEETGGFIGYMYADSKSSYFYNCSNFGTITSNNHYTDLSEVSSYKLYGTGGFIGELSSSNSSEAVYFYNSRNAGDVTTSSWGNPGYAYNWSSTYLAYVEQTAWYSVGGFVGDAYDSYNFKSITKYYDCVSSGKVGIPYYPGAYASQKIYPGYMFNRSYATISSSTWLDGKGYTYSGGIKATSMYSLTTTSANWKYDYPGYDLLYNDVGYSNYNASRDLKFVKFTGYNENVNISASSEFRWNHTSGTNYYLKYLPNDDSDDMYFNLGGKNGYSVIVNSRTSYCNGYSSTSSGPYTTSTSEILKSGASKPFYFDSSRMAEWEISLTTFRELSGEGTISGPYLVPDAESFDSIKYYDGEDVYFKQTGDFEVLTTLQSLKGHYNGDNHSITTNVDSRENDYYMIYEIQSGATLSNIKISATYLYGNGYDGGVQTIINNNYGIITNVDIIGIISYEIIAQQDIQINIVGLANYNYGTIQFSRIYMYGIDGYSPGPLGSMSANVNGIVKYNRGDIIGNSISFSSLFYDFRRDQDCYVYYSLCPIMYDCYYTTAIVEGNYVTFNEGVDYDYPVDDFDIYLLGYIIGSAKYIRDNVIEFNDGAGLTNEYIVSYSTNTSSATFSDNIIIMGDDNYITITKSTGFDGTPKNGNTAANLSGTIDNERSLQYYNYADSSWQFMSPIAGGSLDYWPTSTPSVSGSTISVSNGRQLAALKNMDLDSKTIKLTADINLSVYMWDSIEGGEAMTFDGQGHTISNMYINVGLSQYGKTNYTSGIGLFSYLETSSEIRNVNFAGCKIVIQTMTNNRNQNIGILAGSAGDYVIVENVNIYNSSIIVLDTFIYDDTNGSNLYRIGTLLGDCIGIHINECESVNNIINLKEFKCDHAGIGGLIGDININSGIENCVLENINIVYNQYEISTRERVSVGFIAGFIDGLSIISNQIQNCNFYIEAYHIKGKSTTDYSSYVDMYISMVGGYGGTSVITNNYFYNNDLETSTLIGDEPNYMIGGLGGEINSSTISYNMVDGCHLGSYNGAEKGVLFDNISNTVQYNVLRYRHNFNIAGYDSTNIASGMYGTTGSGMTVISTLNYLDGNFTIGTGNTYLQKFYRTSNTSQDDTDVTVGYTIYGVSKNYTKAAAISGGHGLWELNDNKIAMNIQLRNTSNIFDSIFIRDSAYVIQNVRANGLSDYFYATYGDTIGYTRNSTNNFNYKVTAYQKTSYAGTVLVTDDDDGQQTTVQISSTSYSIGALELVYTTKYYYFAVQTNAPDGTVTVTGASYLGKLSSNNNYSVYVVNPGVSYSISVSGVTLDYHHTSETYKLKGIVMATNITSSSNPDSATWGSISGISDSTYTNDSNSGTFTDTLGSTDTAFNGKTSTSGNMVGYRFDFDKLDSTVTINNSLIEYSSGSDKESVNVGNTKFFFIMAYTTSEYTAKHNFDASYLNFSVRADSSVTFTLYSQVYTASINRIEYSTGSTWTTASYVSNSGGRYTASVWTSVANYQVRAVYKLSTGSTSITFTEEGKSGATSKYESVVGYSSTNTATSFTNVSNGSSFSKDIGSVVYIYVKPATNYYISSYTLTRNGSTITMYPSQTTDQRDHGIILLRYNSSNTGYVFTSASAAINITLSQVTWSNLALVATPSGSGTAGSPLIIDNPAKFGYMINAFNDNSSIVARINANIDLSVSIPTPVKLNGGSTLAVTYSGIYTKQISSVGTSGSIYGPTDRELISFIGLKMTCDPHAALILNNYGIIKNLYFLTPILTTHYSQGTAAPIAVVNFGTIQNVGVNNPQLNAVHAGGITGETRKLIDSCFVKNLNATNVSYLGGISRVGNYGSTISNSYVTLGTISNTGRFGGIVDHVDTLIIRNCYVAKNSTTASSYGTSSQHNGGLVSYKSSTGTVTLTQSFVQSGIGFSSLVYNPSSTTITNTGSDFKSTTDMKNMSTFFNAGWDFDDIWTMTSENFNRQDYFGYPFLYSSNYTDTVEIVNAIYRYNGDNANTDVKSNYMGWSIKAPSRVHNSAISYSYTLTKATNNTAYLSFIEQWSTVSVDYKANTSLGGRGEYGVSQSPITVTSSLTSSGSTQRIYVYLYSPTVTITLDDSSLYSTMTTSIRYDVGPIDKTLAYSIDKSGHNTAHVDKIAIGSTYLVYDRAVQGTKTIGSTTYLVSASNTQTGAIILGGTFKENVTINFTTKLRIKVTLTGLTSDTNTTGLVTKSTNGGAAGNVTIGTYDFIPINAYYDFNVKSYTNSSNKTKSRVIDTVSVNGGQIYKNNTINDTSYNIDAGTSSSNTIAKATFVSTTGSTYKFVHNSDSYISIIVTYKRSFYEYKFDFNTIAKSSTSTITISAYNGSTKTSSVDVSNANINSTYVASLFLATDYNPTFIFTDSATFRYITTLSSVSTALDISSNKLTLSTRGDLTIGLDVIEYYTASVNTVIDNTTAYGEFTTSSSARPSASLGDPSRPAYKLPAGFTNYYDHGTQLYYNTSVTSGYENLYYLDAGQSSSNYSSTKKATITGNTTYTATFKINVVKVQVFIVNKDLFNMTADGKNITPSLYAKNGSASGTDSKVGSLLLSKQIVSNGSYSSGEYVNHKYIEYAITWGEEIRVSRGDFYSNNYLKKLNNIATLTSNVIQVSGKYNSTGAATSGADNTLHSVGASMTVDTSSYNPYAATTFETTSFAIVYFPLIAVDMDYQANTTSLIAAANKSGVFTDTMFKAGTVVNNVFTASTTNVFGTGQNVQIQLTIPNAPGYTFNGWKIKGSSAVYNTGTYVIDDMSFKVETNSAVTLSTITFNISTDQADSNSYIALNFVSVFTEKTYTLSTTYSYIGTSASSGNRYTYYEYKNTSWDGYITLKVNDNVVIGYYGYYDITIFATTPNVIGNITASGTCTQGTPKDVTGTSAVNPNAATSHAWITMYDIRSDINITTTILGHVDITTNVNIESPSNDSTYTSLSDSQIYSLVGLKENGIATVRNSLSSHLESRGILTYTVVPKAGYAVTSVTSTQNSVSQDGDNYSVDVTTAVATQTITITITEKSYNVNVVCGSNSNWMAELTNFSKDGKNYLGTAHYLVATTGTYKIVNSTANSILIEVIDNDNKIRNQTIGANTTDNVVVQVDELGFKVNFYNSSNTVIPKSSITSSNVKVGSLGTSYTINHFGTIDVSAVGPYNFKFANWTASNITVSSPSTQSTTLSAPTANATVTANWTRLYYFNTPTISTVYYTEGMSDDGGSYSKVISGTKNANNFYTAGSVITITPNASTGYYVAGVTFNTTTDTASPYSYTATDTTYEINTVVRFKELSYNLTFNAQTGGSVSWTSDNLINPGTGNPRVVGYFSNVKITATANNNDYRFTGWDTSGLHAQTVSSSSPVITMDGFRATSAVTAKFVKQDVLTFEYFQQRSYVNSGGTVSTVEIKVNTGSMSLVSNVVKYSFNGVSVEISAPTLLVKSGTIYVDSTDNVQVKVAIPNDYQFVQWLLDKDTMYSHTVNTANVKSSYANTNISGSVLQQYKIEFLMSEIQTNHTVSIKNVKLQDLDADGSVDSNPPTTGNDLILPNPGESINDIYFVDPHNTSITVKEGQSVTLVANDLQLLDSKNYTLKFSHWTFALSPNNQSTGSGITSNDIIASSATNKTLTFVVTDNRAGTYTANYIKAYFVGEGRAADNQTTSRNNVYTYDQSESMLNDNAGSVTIAGNVNSDKTVTVGNTFTLTAVTNENYRFVGWSKNNYTVFSTSVTLSVQSTGSLNTDHYYAIYVRVYEIQVEHKVNDYTNASHKQMTSGYNYNIQYSINGGTATNLVNGKFEVVQGDTYTIYLTYSFGSNPIKYRIKGILCGNLDLDGVFNNANTFSDANYTQTNATESRIYTFESTPVATINDAVVQNIDYKTLGINNQSLASYNIAYEIDGLTSNVGHINAGVTYYDLGTRLTLTHTLNAGFAATNWTVTNQSGNTNYELSNHLITLTSNISKICINTYELSYSITVNVMPSVGGAATLIDSNCEDEGFGTIGYFGQLILGNQNNEGYTFKSWQVSTESTANCTASIDNVLGTIQLNNVRAAIVLILTYDKNVEITITGRDNQTNLNLPNDLPIEFNGQDTHFPINVRGYEGVEMTISAAPIINDHKFIHWAFISDDGEYNFKEIGNATYGSVNGVTFTVNNTTGQITFAPNEHMNGTLTAVYNPLYTVTIQASTNGVTNDYSGGHLILNEITEIYGNDPQLTLPYTINSGALVLTKVQFSTILKMDIFANEGYDFNGWRDGNENCEYLTELTRDYLVYTTITLTAVFTQKVDVEIAINPVGATNGYTLQAWQEVVISQPTEDEPDKPYLTEMQWNNIPIQPNNIYEFYIFTQIRVYVQDTNIGYYYINCTDHHDNVINITDSYYPYTLNDDVTTITFNYIVLQQVKVVTDPNLSGHTMTLTQNGQYPGVNHTSTSGVIDTVVIQTGVAITITTQDNFDNYTFQGWYIGETAIGATTALTYTVAGSSYDNPVTITALYYGDDFKIKKDGLGNLITYDTVISNQLNNSNSERQYPHIEDVEGAKLLITAVQDTTIIKNINIYAFYGYYYYINGSGEQVKVEHTWIDGQSNNIFEIPNNINIVESTIYITCYVKSWTDPGVASTSLTGSGSLSDPYIIDTPNDFGWIANQSNVQGVDFTNKYFNLTTDIDFTSRYMPTIANFNGILNGYGNQISNYYIINGKNHIYGYTSEQCNFDASMIANSNGGIFKSLDINRMLNVTKLSTPTGGTFMTNGTNVVIDNFEMYYELKSTDLSQHTLNTNSILIENVYGAYISRANITYQNSINHNNTKSIIGNNNVTSSTFTNPFSQVDSNLVIVNSYLETDLNYWTSDPLAATHTNVVGVNNGSLSIDNVFFVNDLWVHSDIKGTAPIAAIIGHNAATGVASVNNSVFKSIKDNFTNLVNVQPIVSQNLGTVTGANNVSTYNGYDAFNGNMVTYIPYITNDYILSEDSIIDSKIFTESSLRNNYSGTTITPSAVSSKNGYISVTTKEQLMYALDQLENNAAVHTVELANDIDVAFNYGISGFNIPAGKKLDGRGYTIFNLKLKGYLNVFNTIAGTLTRIRFENIVANSSGQTGTNNYGLIAKTVTGEILGVHILDGLYYIDNTTGTAVGIGMMFGVLNGATVTSISASGAFVYANHLSGEQTYIGGLVGTSANSTINQYASNITMSVVGKSTQTKAGMIVGASNKCDWTDGYSRNNAYNQLHAGLIHTFANSATSGAVDRYYFGGTNNKLSTNVIGATTTSLTTSYVYVLNTATASTDANSVRTLAQMQNKATYETYSFVNIWAYDPLENDSMPTLLMQENTHTITVRIIGNGSVMINHESVDPLETTDEYTEYQFILAHGSQIGITFTADQYNYIQRIDKDSATIHSATEDIKEFGDVIEILDNDYLYVATFDFDSYDITSAVSSYSTGYGQVVPLGTGSYQHHEIVSFTATPTATDGFTSYRFDHWRFSSEDNQSESVSVALEDNSTYSIVQNADGSNTISFSAHPDVVGTYYAVFMIQYLVEVSVSVDSAIVSANINGENFTPNSSGLVYSEYVDGYLEYTKDNQTPIGMNFVLADGREVENIVFGDTTIYNYITGMVGSYSSTYRFEFGKIFNYKLSSSTAGQYMFEMKWTQHDLEITHASPSDDEITGGVFGDFTIKIVGVNGTQNVSGDSNDSFVVTYGDVATFTIKSDLRYNLNNLNYTLNSVGDVAFTESTYTDGQGYTRYTYTYVTQPITDYTLLTITYAKDFWFLGSINHTDEFMTSNGGNSANEFSGTLFTNGKGTKANPIMIDTAAQLARLAYVTNTDDHRLSGYYFDISTDLDMGNYFWKPIIGLGVNIVNSDLITLSNIFATIYASGTQAVCFMKYANNCTIENLIFENINLIDTEKAESGWTSTFFGSDNVNYNNVHITSGNMYGRHMAGFAMASDLGALNNIFNCSISNVVFTNNPNTWGLTSGFISYMNNTNISYSYINNLTFNASAVGSYSAFNFGPLFDGRDNRISVNEMYISNITYNISVLSNICNFYSHSNISNYYYGVYVEDNGYNTFFDNSTHSGVHTISNINSQSLYTDLSFGTFWDWDSSTNLPKIKYLTEQSNMTGSLNGIGTATDPYLISSEDDLYKFVNIINNGDVSYNTADTHYKLTADITMSPYYFNTITKPFNGTLDGDYRTITDMITRQSLFDTLSSTSKIININFENHIVLNDNKDDNTGALVSYIQGALVENVNYNAKVLKYTFSGGIIAGNGYGNLKSITLSGVVNGIYTGGLMGIFKFENTETQNILNISNYSHVRGTYSAGGIIGYCSTTSDAYKNTLVNMNNLYNNNVISAFNCAGGIVGHITILQNVSIKNVYNNSNIAISKSAITDNTINPSTTQYFFGELIGYFSGKMTLENGYYNSDFKMRHTGDANVTFITTNGISTKCGVAGSTITNVGPKTTNEMIDNPYFEQEYANWWYKASSDYMFPSLRHEYSYRLFADIADVEQEFLVYPKADGQNFDNTGNGNYSYPMVDQFAYVDLTFIDDTQTQVRIDDYGNIYVTKQFADSNLIDMYVYSISGKIITNFMVTDYYGEYSDVLEPEYFTKHNDFVEYYYQFELHEDSKFTFTVENDIYKVTLNTDLMADLGYQVMPGDEVNVVLYNLDLNIAVNGVCDGINDVVFEELLGGSYMLAVYTPMFYELDFVSSEHVTVTSNSFYFTFVLDINAPEEVTIDIQATKTADYWIYDFANSPAL